MKSDLKNKNLIQAWRNPEQWVTYAFRTRRDYRLLQVQTIIGSLLVCALFWIPASSMNVQPHLWLGAYLMILIPTMIWPLTWLRVMWRLTQSAQRTPNQAL